MKTKEEFEILTADATSGDSNAQNALGYAYGAGDGVMKDYSKALEWFRKSAGQNNKYACFNVGLYYELGRGIKKDIHEAIKWYTKGAELGFAKGAFALGRLYENGFKPSILEVSNGVKSLTANADDAFYWYKRATLEEEGRFELARCYELGIGTPVNMRKAAETYRNTKSPRAQERLNNLLEKFNPEEETRLKTLTLFSRNPNRVIGVYANSSSREIKANLSKIEAYQKVGKALSFLLDDYLPCTIARRTLYHTDSLQKLHAEVNNCANLTWKKNRIEYLIKTQETKLKDIIGTSENNADWNETVLRTQETLNLAISALEDEKTRILNALFWFHCNTQEDKTAFNLIQQGKWEEAISIWNKSDSYSAFINMAVFEWYNREDCLAIQDLLIVIRDDKKRADFLSAINISFDAYSCSDIKRILWDGLFSEFPPTEREFEWHMLGSELEYKILTDCGFNEEDDLYILNKTYQQIVAPLNELLQKTKNWDGVDFVVGSQNHDNLYLKGKQIIKRIERLFGCTDSRYIKVCDEVSRELLEYGIAHNNNCKEWSAPSTALRMAQWAESLAISELLKNRCQKNVIIFEENKRIATTDKIIETIDEKLCVQESLTPTFRVVETMIKESDLHLSCLKTEIGASAPLYVKVSSALVNRILNVLIKVCNKKDDFTTASAASSNLKKFENFVMDAQTRERFNRNKKIISDNMNVALMQGKLGSLDFSNQERKVTKSERRKKYTYKAQTKTRILHKVIATLFAISAFIGIMYYLNYENTWEYFIHACPWWLYACVCFEVILTLFVILVWALEFQDDPYDSSCDWMDDFCDGTNKIADAITKAGVQGRKTYSWPFAIPFQLLTLAGFIVRFPLMGISWIVTKL